MSNLENNTTELENLLEMAKNLPTAGAGAVQSDWAQTDETQLDYIKNKPGDLIEIENDEEILNISSLPIGEDADGIIDTIFTHPFSPLNGGEKVQVELKLLNQEDPIIFNDIEVISDGEDGQILIINTNQSLDEAVENGLIKNDDTLPAFFLYLSGEDSLDLISWEDYSGSSLKINKKTQTADYIKLSNNALNLDTEVKKDSSNLITSGGVYNAIQNIDIGKPYTAGNLIKIENGVISSTLGDGHTGVQETQVLETNYLANGDNTMMPPFYVWQYSDNPTSFVIDDKVYLYCTDSSGVEKLVGEGVMEQNDSIDTVFGSGTQIGCKFNISSSWSDLFGLSTGVPIINPVDSSITINGNIAQFIFLQNLYVPNIVVFGAAQDYPNIKFRVSKDVLSTDYVKLPNEALTFDSEPIEGSMNLVNSDALFKAFQNVSPNLEFDDVPTSGSDKLVKSDGIYTAINNAIRDAIIESWGENY